MSDDSSSKKAECRDEFDSFIADALSQGLAELYDDIVQQARRVAEETMMSLDEAIVYVTTFHGAVAERSNAAVLKTADAKASVGSNPTRTDHITWRDQHECPR